MMKKPVISMFIFLFVFMFLLQTKPIATVALSCAEMPTVEEAYEKYDGVVVGQVEEVNKKNDHNEVRVTVSKSFKGIETRELLVNEDMTWGNLNGPSEVGAQYLFFLKMNKGEWENPLCSPTMEIAEASEELEYLKDKEITLKSDAAPTASSSDHMGGGDPSSISWTAIVTAAVIVTGIVLFAFIRNVRRQGKH